MHESTVQVLLRGLEQNRTQQNQVHSSRMLDGEELVPEASEAYWQIVPITTNVNS